MMIRSPACRSATLAALCITLGSALPQHAYAQDTRLDRVQNLIATGRFTDAENTLTSWERDVGSPGTAAPSDRARALYLRGLLTSDAAEAESIFIGLVLSYPSSAVAPDALLRLGQATLAAGDARRAIAYLERLRSDYPGSNARRVGMLWLARALHTNGAAGAACRTARDGISSTDDPNLRMLLEIERDRACGVGDTAAVEPPPAARPARVDDRAANDSAARPAAAAGSGMRVRPYPGQGNEQYAIQIAAFRELRSALAVAAQLADGDIDARVITTPGSPLYRVRHGAFAATADAARAAERVRAAGFAVMIVSDARDEQLVRNPPRW